MLMRRIVVNEKHETKQFIFVFIPQISQMHRQEEIRVRALVQLGGRSALTRKPRRRHRQISAVPRSLDTFRIRQIVVSTTFAYSAAPC